jgi:hypothetical protein
LIDTFVVKQRFAGTCYKFSSGSISAALRVYAGLMSCIASPPDQRYEVLSAACSRQGIASAAMVPERVDSLNVETLRPPNYFIK